MRLALFNIYDPSGHWMQGQCGQKMTDSSADATMNVSSDAGKPPMSMDLMPIALMPMAPPIPMATLISRCRWLYVRWILDADGSGTDGSPMPMAPPMPMDPGLVAPPMPMAPPIRHWLHRCRWLH